jgi:hypothetical protein
MTKVRPTEPLPAGAGVDGSIQLIAARGECEAAQIVVSAQGEPAKGVRATAEALRPAEASERPLPVLLYREAFLDLQVPSDIEGTTGLWPDPLIPVVDDLVHEPRKAFPVEVPAGRHQPIYVEVCVPQETRPGDYSGAIFVSAEGRPSVRVPISISVRAVTVPATSSIPVTFGLSVTSLMNGHRSAGNDMELLRRYARDALRHRVSLHTMSMRPPRITGFGSALQVDFREWDAEIGPFMDGQVGLDGARFSAIDLRTPRQLSGDDLTTYYRIVAQHFREKGWLNRLFAYVMDEPKPGQYPELTRRLQALAPVHDIRRMVTVSLDSSLVGLVDIWNPNLNCVDYKRRPDEFCHRWASRESYDSRLAVGDGLWWYQSCNSHGCGHPKPGARPDPYFAGWPSYMIDIDGAAARIMGWLTFSRHIQGELYFDMVAAYNPGAGGRQGHEDPWDSVYAFGGNGDGTLFYPGRPDRIGGHTDIPIESLRLKQIRDGLEDYELLHLLASTGPEGQRRAQAIADRMTPHLYQFARSPEAFQAAREEIFAALAAPDQAARR